MENKYPKLKAFLTMSTAQLSPIPIQGPKIYATSMREAKIFAKIIFLNDYKVICEVIDRKTYEDRIRRES